MAKSSSDFKDSLIIVSNSDLDGFREGDGDLMDKMVMHLNDMGIKAVRVIQTIQDVPKDKYELFDKGQLIALSDKKKDQLSSPDERRVLQETFKQFIGDRQKEGKDIILYVGSRINVVYEREQPVLSESGSLFTRDLMEDLQGKGVKTAVNCLEYAFFKRSPAELPRAVEMTRQQLFVADKIHFLNQYDQLDFARTMEQLQESPVMRLHPKAEALFLSEGRPIPSLDLSADIERMQAASKPLGKLPEKGVFISGIFTVNPLTAGSGDLAVTEDKQRCFMEQLADRPRNVLCFGLIRGDKGLTEAVELGTLFKESGLDSKVIIAGKCMGSFLMCQGMMKDIFEVEKPAELRKETQKILNAHLGLTEDKAINLNRENAEEIFRVRFGEDLESFNSFTQKLYDHLEQTLPKKANVEVHCNVSEEEVRDLAMQCRYAIKLDNKGMANNASTIASCLGFYLPTFATVGIVTGDDFREKGRHDIDTACTVIPHKYQGSVIMGGEEYRLAKVRGDNVELRPCNPAIEAIFEIVQTEDNEKYRGRLQTLEQLHSDKLFDARHVTALLVEQVFAPLHLEILAEKERKQGVMLEVEAVTSVSAHDGWDGVERRSNTPLREALKPLEALGGREHIVELLGQARNLAPPSSMEVKHLDNVGDIHLSATQAAKRANNPQLKR